MTESKAPAVVHPPSMLRGDIDDPKLAAALRTLELTVKQKLDGVLHGDHLGLIPGPGSEPGESRLYQPGDDVRRMDWAVTARTTHPHVRQMIADRELETWLVVDMSASLDFGTACCEKRDLAVAAAAAITFLNSGGGNRLGALIANGAAMTRVPARTGRQHQHTMLRTIATMPQAPAGVRGDLAVAIDALRRPERRRGMAVIISDFLGPINWMRPLRAIAARHEVLAIEVLDPRDVELPDVGDVVLQDAESGVVREFSIDPALRDDFARAAAAHRADVARTIRGCGAPLLSLRTDRDWLADIVRFVASRGVGHWRDTSDGSVMTLPLLGPMTLSGFAHSWFFLFLFVVAGLVALYILMQLARQRRMLRFANMELLESVAPKRPSRWRHVPAILLVLSLLLFTIAMAGPTHDVRIPRNRAVVMLVIDVSQSMRATDVEPSRMVAAQEAAKQFADELTPGINLGLIAYAGTATVLVSPTTNREATKNALDKLQFADRTATGEAIFTALQAIATVGAVIGGGDTPPPARIVLFSDGKETMPTNPDNPKGAYTAARTAKDQGVPISTISFGTPYGFVEINDQRQPVPVDDETMKKVAQLSGGNSYNAATLAELRAVYSSLQQQIGYETIKGDASVGWLRLGALALALAALAALLINRRLPT
ncbi:Conserved membrane protein of uncharacterised function [Mycobacterium tuberculosis]|nr:Conserved membrane protein of uncharacterised function [Mycobacterium tuberculosis]